jgi:hypothetical protein
MGLTVYAGSAQLAVLPLMAVGAPLWVVWFTAICVNLRFVILSSMWRSYFANLSLRHRLAVAYFSGDVIFVNFMRRYPEARPQPEQLPYFWGAALTNWLAWQIPSTLGISWPTRFLCPGAGLCRRAGVVGRAAVHAQGPRNLGGLHRGLYGSRGGFCAAAQAQYPGGDRRCRGCRPDGRATAKQASRLPAVKNEEERS